MDTHTAVAWSVYEKWAKENENGHKSVVLSTASAYKFSASVMSALGKEFSDEFDALEKLYNETKIPMPSALVGIKDKEIVHHNVVAKDKTLEFVKAMIEKKTW